MAQPLLCSIWSRMMSSASLAAQMVQTDLKQCGLQVESTPQPAEVYLAAGPEGLVFGRQFDLAQFAWMTAVEPPCSLYLTNEIPGPYPDTPKGWGGVMPAVIATRSMTRPAWMHFTHCPTRRSMLKSMLRRKRSSQKTCPPCRSTGITGGGRTP